MDADPDLPIDAGTGRLLAGSLGHGLRTPLHSLLGFLELLAMTDLDDEQRHTVESVIAGADGLLDNCDRLLMLVQALSGGMPTAEPFSLAEAVAAAVAAGAPDAAVTVRIAPETPAQVIGDPAAVRHVLTELVRNAARHGSLPVTVEVESGGEVAGDRTMFRLRVTDSGPGLPEAAAERLTGVAAAGPAGGGAGFGLHLVRAVVAGLGGEVRLIGRQRGAEVLLRLPLRVAAAGHAAAPSAGETGPRHLGLRVLLVEDNPVNRILAQRQLGRLGHHLTVATDGGAGLRRLAEEHFDVVLLDRHLPDIDGVEVVRRIRAGETAQGLRRRVPVIGVSADALPGNRQECLDAGMDGFLSKPVDLDHLRAALDEFVPPIAGHEWVDDDEIPHLDPEALRWLRAEMGGDEPVAQLAAAYLAELPGRRLRLQLAVRKREARTTIVVAENLGASSTTVGAQRLARLCADLAAAARAGDLGTCEALLPALADVCGATAAALSSAFPDAATAEPLAA